MSEQTPSQAEGEQQEATSTDGPVEGNGRDVPRTTPSQAEGTDVQRDEEGERGEQGEERKAWESGWSGP
jgi:hypothetical protein